MQKLEQLYEGKAKKVFKTDDPNLYIVAQGRVEGGPLQGERGSRLADAVVVGKASSASP